MQPLQNAFDFYSHPAASFVSTVHNADTVKRSINLEMNVSTAFNLVINLKSTPVAHPCMQLFCTLYVCYSLCTSFITESKTGIQTVSCAEHMKPSHFQYMSTTEQFRFVSLIPVFYYNSLPTPAFCQCFCLYTAKNIQITQQT